METIPNQIAKPDWPAIAALLNPAVCAARLRACKPASL